MNVNLPDPLRLELEQARDRVDALDDALRVVEPLHAEADLVARAAC